MQSIFITTIIFFLITACAAPPVTATISPTITLTATPFFTATPTFSPEQAQQMQAVNEMIKGWGVDASEWNYSYNTETGELGIYLAKNAFLGLRGEVKLTLADGSVVDLKSSDVSFDGSDTLNLNGYKLDENGEWVEAVEPTPEIKDYPICQIENFRNCPFTVEELTNGTVDAWLNTLSKPFDPAKINDVPLVDYSDVIMYDTNTAPNFKVPGSEPFHRDTTAGFIVYEKDGVKYEYIFLPVEFYDKKTGKSHWIKVVDPIYDRNTTSAKTVEVFDINAWKNKMKTTPIVNSNLLPFVNISDPLVGLTFEKNPDMAERLEKFVSGEDMSALSESNIVLLTSIGINAGHWYE